MIPTLQRPQQIFHVNISFLISTFIVTKYFNIAQVIQYIFLTKKHLFHVVIRELAWHALKVDGNEKIGGSGK